MCDPFVFALLAAPPSPPPASYYLWFLTSQGLEREGRDEKQGSRKVFLPLHMCQKKTVLSCVGRNQIIGWQSQIWAKNKKPLFKSFYWGACQSSVGKTSIKLNNQVQSRQHSSSRRACCNSYCTLKMKSWQQRSFLSHFSLNTDSGSALLK